MSTGGVAICHYNRTSHLQHIIQCVKKTTPGWVKVIVCDDSSEQADVVAQICDEEQVVLIRGKSRGNPGNKNRALFALQDCDYVCLLEDDCKPVSDGWFEAYAAVAAEFGINHFCRVVEKRTTPAAPEIDRHVKELLGYTLEYSSKLRGDMIFVTRRVLEIVGGWCPMFRGCGHAHQEWSGRIFRAGLIAHPNRWIDLVECEWESIGDRQGGRWNEEEECTKQIARNEKIMLEISNTPVVYWPLRFE